ncbi:hypothetical protein ACLKA7_011585 [Drosophila subpalustris]
MPQQRQPQQQQSWITLSGDQSWKYLDSVRGRNFGLFRFLSTDLTRRPGLGTLGHPWNEILVSSVSQSGVHHLTPPEEDDLASKSEPRGSGDTMRTTQRVSGVPSSPREIGKEKQSQDASRTTTQAEPRRKQSHDASRTTTQAEPRRKQSHDASRTTTQAEPRRKQNHDASRATTQAEPRHKQNHDASRATTQAEPRRKQSHDTSEVGGDTTQAEAEQGQRHSRSRATAEAEQQQEQDSKSHRGQNLRRALSLKGREALQAGSVATSAGRRAKVNRTEGCYAIVCKARGTMVQPTIHGIANHRRLPSAVTTRSTGVADRGMRHPNSDHRYSWRCRQRHAPSQQRPPILMAVPTEACATPAVTTDTHGGADRGMRHPSSDHEIHWQCRKRQASFLQKTREPPSNHPRQYGEAEFSFRLEDGGGRPISKTLSGDQSWKYLDSVRGRNFGLFRFLSTDLTRRPGLGTLGHPWNEILVSSVSQSGVHHLTPPEEDDLASKSEPRGSGDTMRTTQRVSGVPSSSSWATLGLA